nr:MAG TPA: hypothetical protein [Caudoviricetes sp.]
MTLRELAVSGIQFKRCSILAIVEEGRVDFPVTYTEDLGKVTDKWLDRQVLSIYSENQMLFIELSKEEKLVSLLNFDGMQRQTTLSTKILG